MRRRKYRIRINYWEVGELYILEYEYDTEAEARKQLNVFNNSPPISHAHNMKLYNEYYEILYEANKNITLEVPFYA